MKTISVKVSEADLEWLDSNHWDYRMSRAAFAAKLLSDAIAQLAETE